MAAPPVPPPKKTPVTAILDTSKDPYALSGSASETDDQADFFAFRAKTKTRLGRFRLALRLRSPRVPLRLRLGLGSDVRAIEMIRGQRQTAVVRPAWRDPALSRNRVAPPSIYNVCLPPLPPSALP